MTGQLFVPLAFVAALGSGLIAGVFFAFSVFIMTALGRLSSEQGIAAMQSINIVVINPWFLGVFLGTAAVAIVLVVVMLFDWQDSRAIYALAGCLLYVVGSVIVTMAFNVPLNDALAAVKPESADGAAVWARYLTGWTLWNHVRTIASLAAMASFIMAMR